MLGAVTAYLARSSAVGGLLSSAIHWQRITRLMACSSSVKPLLGTLRIFWRFETWGNHTESRKISAAYPSVTVLLFYHVLFIFPRRTTNSSSCRVLRRYLWKGPNHTSTTMHQVLSSHSFTQIESLPPFIDTPLEAMVDVGNETTWLES